MKRVFANLGLMRFNGEPSHVYLLFQTVFFASSIIRRRWQLDIACDTSEPRRLTREEQEFFNQSNFNII